jgi:phospholipid transport system substrate-binding protein
MAGIHGWPRSAVLALTLAASVVAAPAVWAGEPTDTMREFFAGVNLVLTDPGTDDQPLEKLKAIRRRVDEVFDFREAAMLALGREWSSHAAVEQNEFVVLFTDLLERSFVWRMAGKASLDGGVKVQYIGETVTGDTAAVDTTVATRDGNELKLDYRMVRRADRWVVRDVVMDGVSTMENYHAQFQRVVRDTSWRDLMAQLRAKLGAPPAPVQVASAAPVVAPSRPLSAPVMVPLGPLDLDRPPAEERHGVGRDLAAFVTPGLAVRDVSPLPAPRQLAAPIAAPSATPRQPSQPTSVVAPAEPPAPERTIVVAPGPETGAASTPVPAVIAVTAPAEPAHAVRPAIARPTTAAVSGYWIQVGAFRNRAIAGRVAARVKGEIFVVAGEATAGGRTEPLLRVRIGPFKDRAHVSSRLRELKALGYQPFVASK